VGRDDIVELEDTSACELLQSVMMEFDESLFPDVEFKIECGEITVICDKKKLIRALRNAVENALKYLPDRKGKIILKAIIENNNYIYSVRDNGKGMDADTKVRMLIPYFTTAKKSGGSGIGTMIMQKVAELHNGKINVESEPGKGTEVQFIFPIQSLKLYKKYKGRYDK